jgi:hypothetical protein
MIMVKRKRRNLADYEDELMRFEEWLESNYSVTVYDFKNEDELIESLERWLRSIDVHGKHASNFAIPIIRLIAGRTTFDGRDVKEKEVDIIESFGIRRTGKDWIKGETGFLERNYIKKNVSVSFIAQELGRSRRAVYNRAYKLGLKRPKGARKK